jgi:hypothetical protein
MFWKREKTITYSPVGPLLQIQPPPKKDFQTMLELLRDAEKFDNSGEKDVSNATLKNLCEFIQSYVARSSVSEHNEKPQHQLCDHYFPSTESGFKNCEFCGEPHGSFQKKEA